MSETVINLLIKGSWETIVMTLVSGFFGFVIGLPVGILLYLTRKDQLLENKIVHQVVAFFVNIFRSIPFIILIVWMIPFTRNLVGTSIGVVAALVPLSVGAAPFIARLVENSLLEVPSGLIEAARSMGAKPMQIIRKVLLPEALPSLINAATITLITLVGYSAMGGAVGAGGLGQVGYQYGYVGYDIVIMNTVLILLIIIVFILQFIGDKLSKKFNHK
ncbi:D-methionine transport system permease protein [Chishuiella changwenlii]|jgi:D-methionine transport system permease protein|uniref:D-methionine transport system permease protein MetI n=1 Tax=Chishuiella changwenlii TaxID=1434701 RepID=A0A1M6SP09_9FLAO|nr:methionine ABC transporter permease MetI [Chishuiella changwenlii]GGF07721.1 methionine ABC transporter permease [Chishuiella changwenlii]SHK46482.1 D-methionine transport system permease protein [Chishuiella changwenlii]